MRVNEKYTYRVADLIGVSYKDIFWYQIEQGCRRIEMDWPGDTPHRIAMKAAIKQTPEWWDWYISLWERHDRSICMSLMREQATGTIYWKNSKSQWAPLADAWQHYRELHTAERFKAQMPIEVVDKYLDRIRHHESIIG